jgi:hypothetical protein
MKRACSFALILSLVSVGDAVASPWVKAPGTGYAKVSGSTFSTNQVVDASGQSTQTPWQYTNHSVTTYFDVGVAPRVGLNLTLPFHIADNSYESLVYQRSGLGDLGLGLSFAILEGRCPLTAAVGGSIPLYDGVIPSDAEIAGATGGSNPAERYLPALGDGAYELTPGLAVGCSFYPVPGWATAKVSYQARSNGFGDGIRGSFGTGAFVLPERLAIMVGVDTVQRFDATAERPTKSYLSAHVAALVRVGWGFSVEGNISHIPGGVFVAKGTTYGLGISYDGRLFPDPY